jgi:hypothetical protein
MSILLKIDEMLDILDWAESPEYLLLKRQAEILANCLAEALVDHVPELTRNGPAVFEGTAFAGTCAPFEPTAPGPVPEALTHFDFEVQQWKDMCNETLSD